MQLYLYFCKNFNGLKNGAIMWVMRVSRLVVLRGQVWEFIVRFVGQKMGFEMESV
jgi:hypothetical protein